jgi:hypothetical protein
MKTILSLICLITLVQSVSAQNNWKNGTLAVSENGRYLQQVDGRPFFWLGDTCWLLAQKLNRDEVEHYFADRKAKGFNVVQTVVVQMLADKNIYGDTALVDGDITKLNLTPGGDPNDSMQYDYWDHVDFIIERAAANDIYLAVAPTWSHTVRRAPISKEQVEIYATVIAERFKNKPNIIWLNGGSAKGDVDKDIWEAIGTTIKKVDKNHLMGFHTFGRSQSSTWFHDASWLDVNMFVSGHRSYAQDIEGKQFGEDNWRYVLDDTAKMPRKPTLDSEPAYENLPQGMHKPEEPYWNADDVRRYAYWAVFAGAAGHTYGENSVRQVYLASDSKPASGAEGYFRERLDAPGAKAMAHLKNLILSHSYFDRVNDQSAIVGDDGERYDRVMVTKGNDYMMAYTYTGREFTVQLGRVAGRKVEASWFNPRTGEFTKIETVKNEGVRSFNPPGEKKNGIDWVLHLKGIQ